MSAVGCIHIIKIIRLWPAVWWRPTCSACSRRRSRARRWRRRHWGRPPPRRTAERTALEVDTATISWDSGPWYMSRKNTSCLRRINLMHEINGNVDSCNPCKRLVPSRLACWWQWVTLVRLNHAWQWSVRNFRIFFSCNWGYWLTEATPENNHQTIKPDSNVIHSPWSADSLLGSYVLRDQGIMRDIRLSHSQCGTHRAVCSWWRVAWWRRCRRCRRASVPARRRRRRSRWTCTASARPAGRPAGYCDAGGRPRSRTSCPPAGQARSGQARWGQVRPGRDRSGKVRTGKVKIKSGTPD